MRSPLSVEEFLAAVTTNATQDITKVNKEDLLAICSSFVVLDEEIDGFKFAHFSVMEFLLRLNEYTAVAAHALAAEACLITCSNHCAILKSSQELSHPLQRYAVLFWAYHCQEAGERGPRSLIQAFLKIEPEVSNRPFLVWQKNLRALLMEFPGPWGYSAQESTLPYQWTSKDEDACRDMLGIPPDPVFAACTWGFPEVVRDRLGLRGGAKAQKWRWIYKSKPKLLKRINEEYLTCFLIACKHGQNSIVQLLLEQRADINQRSGIWKCTGLHLAAIGGHDSTFALLLDKGIRTDLQDDHGQTILLYAVANRCESAVRLLIERDVNTQIDEAMHWAVRYREDRVLQLLLDSDTRNAKAELSALCLACSRSGAVQLLLQRGIDVNGQDANGRSPLHHAASHSVESLLSNFHAEYTVLPLLNAGADLEVRDQDGATPLHLAAKNNHCDVLRTLLEKGANVAAKTNRGQTPMDLVLDVEDDIGKREAKFLMLIDYGFDVEAKAKLREMVEFTEVSSCLDWLLDRYGKAGPYVIKRNTLWWLLYYYSRKKEDGTRSGACLRKFEERYFPWWS